VPAAAARENLRPLRGRGRGHWETATSYGDGNCLYCSMVYVGGKAFAVNTVFAARALDALDAVVHAAACLHRSFVHEA